MHWIEAVILGFVQGLTEFLPISSSAHLRIVGELLPNAQDPGAAFTAITQLGTETAVLVFFRRDIARIITAPTAAALAGPEPEMVLSASICDSGTSSTTPTVSNSVRASAASHL